MAYLAPDGRFLRVNRRFCEIVGYPEAELLERAFPDITHPDDLDIDVGVSQRLLAGALETDAREKRYVAKDGRPVWVERTVSLVRTTDGRPRWFVSVVHDISARKCAEAAVLDYQRRLRELAAQLSRAEERERRNIAADLHDHVGQSLSAMRALLAVARKETAGSPVDGRLEEVSDCLREAIRATRDIMSDLSPPALNELGLSAAISGWLRDEVGGRHGLDTRFSDDGEPMPLDADARTALFRSVRELLANVVKHARASRVSVSLRRNGPMVEIVVEDDGVGMPDGWRPRGAPGESGFGLFSIEERVSDLGGTLTITSAPGGGVRALLTAPLELE
jgi:PAS domain S-box-containing protein